MAAESRESSQLTRRTILKGVGATGALLGAGLPQLIVPALWRQVGAVADSPFGVHLEFGNQPTSEMTVSWVTSGAVQNPRVRFGPSAANLDGVVEAETRTYTDGPSGQEIFTHHASLTGLGANRTYFYEVSHDGAASPVKANFRTAPNGRVPFRFTSFGDQSIPDDFTSVNPNQPWSPYAGLIVPQVEATEPLFHLYNGDLCYANTASPSVAATGIRPRVWASFLNNNSRSARYRPWMPAAGNHENERMDGRPPGATYIPFDSFKAYQTYFSLPASGAYADFRGLWYAFRVGSVQVISLNNDDVCYQNGGNTYVHGYSGGAQKAFLQQTLAAARASRDIDWIVVVMHQVAMSTAIPFNGSELGIREEWLPLFDRYGVDLVVTGHEHHYERTFAVRGQEGADAYRRPIAASHETDSIDTTKGTVHMILGGGGHNNSSYNKYSTNGTFDGHPAFESEILAPQTPGAPAAPWVPIPLITPKPRETATWSPTILSTDPTASHARDSGHGYGFATFDVSPGALGGYTTITVRYQRVLNPNNPADAGKEVNFDSFTLRRPRSDRAASGQALRPAAEPATV